MMPTQQRMVPVVQIPAMTRGTSSDAGNVHAHITQNPPLPARPSSPNGASKSSDILRSCGNGETRSCNVSRVTPAGSFPPAVGRDISGPSASTPVMSSTAQTELPGEVTPASAEEQTVTPPSSPSQIPTAFCTPEGQRTSPSMGLKNLKRPKFPKRRFRLRETEHEELNVIHWLEEVYKDWEKLETTSHSEQQRQSFSIKQEDD